MKVSAAVLLWGLAHVAGDQCEDLCARVKLGLNAQEQCKAELYVLPRPTIGYFCIDAFNTAFEDTCHVACLTNKSGGGSLSQDSLGMLQIAACAEAAQRGPRPKAKESCIAGFKKGVAATISGIEQAIIEASEEDRSELAMLTEYVEEELAAAADAEQAAPETEPIDETFTDEAEEPIEVEVPEVVAEESQQEPVVALDD